MNGVHPESSTPQGEAPNRAPKLDLGRFIRQSRH
jgi:hypothetical protein